MRTMRQQFASFNVQQSILAGNERAGLVGVANLTEPERRLPLCVLFDHRLQGIEDLVDLVGGRIERIALRRDRIIQKPVQPTAQMISIAFLIMTAGPLVKAATIPNQASGSVALKHLPNKFFCTLDRRRGA